MEPRMYRAEPSLVMNAERSEPQAAAVPKLRSEHATDSKDAAFRHIARCMYV